MATIHAHPECEALESVRLASQQSRQRRPIVSAVLAVYLMVAVMQPNQFVCLVVLLPFVLIALNLAFEVTDKLDGIESPTPRT